MEFVPRLISFGGIFILLAILIAFFSRNQNPFYFLVHYNYTAPVVISILFIFLVSHEIIYLILFLISGSKSQGGKNNLVHFIALSLIYLLNIGLLYLKNASHIDWDLIYINGFLLLVMSTIIGLWGFKQREIRYENIMPFRPLGGYLFLSLGMICFATISYHTITLNDPVLETFEDAIVYSHIGFGIMFLLYLLSNFIDLISEKLAVYKIAYREVNMPYYSSNIAGLVVIAAFYYLSNQAALHQAIAGYYNGLGSVYYHDGNNFLAEEYYKRAAIYGFNNHRSNYSIGELGNQQNDLDKAIARFKNATKKNPTEFAYINLANAQKADLLFFDGLFTLREGVRKFPESAQIKNNLGLFFKNTSLLDSAIYYMEYGAHGSWGNKTNTTNIVDLLTRNRVELPVDSLKELYDGSDHLPLKSNLLAYSNNTTKWLDVKIDGNQIDSTLDLHQFAYLYNHGFSKLSNPTASDIYRVQGYGEEQNNVLYSRQLSYLTALLKYKSNDLSACFRSLDQLLNDPLKMGYYNHVLGVISLEQNAPRLAIDFFRRASAENYESANVNLAIALTEAGEKGEALEMWNQLLMEDSIEIANDVILALTAPVSVIATSNSDAIKYQAIRYRSDDFDRSIREILLSSIDDVTFLIGAYISNVESQIEKGNFIEAADHLKEIQSIDESSSYRDLVSNLRNKLMICQVADGQLQMEKSDNEDLKAFWSNVSDPISREFFSEMGMKNPFGEAEVLIASRFFNGQLKGSGLGL